MTSRRERRKVQRIRFKKPVVGNVPGGSISIVDLSITGAKAEHDFPLAAGRNIRLDFLLRDERISLTCHVVRCRLEKKSAGRTSYASGLHFSNQAELAESPLRRLLAEIVGRDLAERRKQRRDIKEDTPIQP